MNSFGYIKTKIEKSFEKGHHDKNFKSKIKGFKKHVLDNRQISEAYYLYDELSSKKGLNEDVVDEYISESFEQLKNIIETNKEKIQKLSDWVDSILEENVNNEYKDIDYQIYTKNIVRNLESLVESKQRIRKNLISPKVVKEEKNYIDLPLSSMFKIATNTFNKEYENLNEEDKKEFKHLVSLKGEQLTGEIDKVKSEVLDKLSKNLNESTESELKEKIQKTINKINESKNNLTSLYKLKQLNKGL